VTTPSDFVYSPQHPSPSLERGRDIINLITYRIKSWIILNLELASGVLGSQVIVNDDACYSSTSSLFLVDHLQFMKKQQFLDCVQVNYLFSPAATITPDDRLALCSWCYSYRRVELFSNINKATACIAVSYLDRFMSTNSARVAEH
jgi:hypothetical protein